MKVVVTMDQDGHFLASLTTERQKCLDVLQNPSIVDIWNDIWEDMLEKCDLRYDDLFECPLNRFEQFLYQFEERGRFEIVEL